MIIDKKKHEKLKSDKFDIHFLQVLILIIMLIAFVVVFCYALSEYKASLSNDYDSDEYLTDVVMSTDNVNSNGDPIVEYDKTDDWANNVAYISQVLNVTVSDADSIMHQISSICEKQFSSKLYFFNRFEKVSGTSNQYYVIAGDMSFALCVSIDVDDDNSYKVMYVSNVDIDKLQKENISNTEE